MAEVATITVLDSDEVEREVPTILSLEQLLDSLVGEVQASPTANTLLARLKTIGDKDFATQTTLAAQVTAIGTIGTRTYGTVERVAVGSASAQSAAVTATEVMLHASVKCYVLAGSNPTAAATTSIPLEAGEKFHMRITSGHKIAVIRDSSDGFLHVVAVA